jgi:hypothetical protein
VRIIVINNLTIKREEINEIINKTKTASTLGKKKIKYQIKDLLD